MKKINLIDVAIVVLIIALIFATYLKFVVYDHTKIDTEMINLEYSIKVTAIREYTVNALKVGDTVYDTQTKLAIGQITDVSFVNSKTVSETTDGKVVVAENPAKYDVTLVIRTDGMETDRAYFADKNVELKVGSEKQFETLYVKTTGTIMSIDKIDE